MDVRLTDIGEGLVSAVISRWLVSPGDDVQQNQPLVEIETEKVTIELPSPAPGRVTSLHVDEGETVAVGALLVTLDASAANADSESHASEPEVREPGVVRKPAKDGRGAGGAVLARPRVRALAKQLGIELSTLVPGSGRDGEITTADVEAAAGEASLLEEEHRVPLSLVRRRAAERLTESWRTIPHVTSFLEIEVDRLLAFKNKTGRSMTGIFVWALVRAVREHPLLNSSLDTDSNEIIIHPDCHVGIAIDTPDGLVVAVVKEATTKSLDEIDDVVLDLVGRARQHTLQPSDVAGSTITLTNMGRAGIHAGTPIINPPEAAVVGVGGFVRKPVLRGDDIVPGTCCIVDCSFDHRIVDGVEGSNFLRKFGAIIEDPQSVE